jgi:chemotaxis protein CheC
VTHVSADEMDAISEVFNIGVGLAASTLSEMVGQEVVLSLPGAKIVERADISRELPASEVPVSSIFQNFCSPFGTGRAILAFPESKSLRLVEVIVGQHGIGELTNLEQEALTEVGNIILNACLAALGDMVGSGIDVSVPEYRALGDWAEMVNGTERDADTLLMLSIQFDLKDMEINGRLMFLLEFAKLRNLINAIASRLLGGAAANA